MLLFSPEIFFSQATYHVKVATVNQVFFILSPEGSLVNFRAYKPYTLVGPTNTERVGTPQLHTHTSTPTINLYNCKILKECSCLEQLLLYKLPNSIDFI